MSTHNIHLRGEIRQTLCGYYPHLPRAIRILKMKMIQCFMPLSTLSAYGDGEGMIIKSSV